MPCQHATKSRSLPLRYQNRNLTDTFPMEKAAISRMAASIIQLTLCRVSTEEIEAATKLLAKASRQLRNVPEVLPQQIADLETATSQLHQLIRSLHSCTTSASYELAMRSAKHKRHSCCCHAQRKALVLLLRSTAHYKPFQRISNELGTCPTCFGFPSARHG